MISKEDVEHIAKLARLSLAPKEIGKFQRDLSSILDYIDQLGKVNVSGVKPTSHSVFIENVMRKDTESAQELETRKKLIEKFPEEKEGYLKTKPIL